MKKTRARPARRFTFVFTFAPVRLSASLKGDDLLPKFAQHTITAKTFATAWLFAAKRAHDYAIIEGYAVSSITVDTQHIERG